MATTVRTPVEPGPGTLDTLSLLVEVADELVVGTARDTHLAWLDRVEGLVGGQVKGLGPHHVVHRTLARGVYGSVGLGLRGARRGLDAVAAARPPQPTDRRLERGPRGRFVRSAVNGLIGDRLAEQRPVWAFAMSVRAGGEDVRLDPASLAGAYPDATGQVVVFVHGLCENESYWDWQVERRGPGYPATVGAQGWTPVMLRVNTGLPLRTNGVALAGLMRDLTEAWPVPVTRIAFVGHSMGGLIVRAATAVVDGDDAPWTDLVSDVVTLGTPHLGAPLAAGVGRGSARLARLPETRAFGRILDWRSVGVHDLVDGLSEDVPALPHARYRLVSGTLTGSPRHPLARALGDALVRQDSAYGRTARGDELFPGAYVLHLPRTGHMTLLNHSRVHRALTEWLG
jgi:pimeloyl-ACP methyl ester carboxylesterase